MLGISEKKTLTGWGKVDGGEDHKKKVDVKPVRVL